jgi:hypothetical protein
VLALELAQSGGDRAFVAEVVSLQERARRGGA